MPTQNTEKMDQQKTQRACRIGYFPNRRGSIEN